MQSGLELVNNFVSIEKEIRMSIAYIFRAQSDAIRVLLSPRLDNFVALLLKLNEQTECEILVTHL